MSKIDHSELTNEDLFGAEQWEKMRQERIEERLEAEQAKLDEMTIEELLPDDAITNLVNDEVFNRIESLDRELTAMDDEELFGHDLETIRKAKISELKGTQ